MCAIRNLSEYLTKSDNAEHTRGFILRQISSASFCNVRSDRKSFTREKGVQYSGAQLSSFL